MGIKPKNLVIVESPAKAKTISKYLGKDYLVRASYGHIMDLSQSGKYNLGVNIDNNFTPKYRLIAEKKDKLKVIIESTRGIERILIAADPDREGEAIAWHLADALESTGIPIYRVMFHEITASSIKKAVADLGDLDSDLYDSQQARRVLDRIVGFLVSPYLSRSLDSNLSAGRVQSVAVRLIVDRERVIEDFKSEKFWTIEVNLSNKLDLNVKLKAQYEKVIKDKSIARNVKKDLESDSIKIVEVVNTTKKRKALPPLITTSLASCAIGLYKFSTKKTMQLAQRLYESGFITYMRTDSVRSSKESITDCRQWLKKNGHDVSARANSYTNKNEVQDAHEAIRPTDIGRSPQNIFVSDEEQKIYELIWNRFIASQMKPALYDTALIKATSSSGHVLKANGRVLKYKGWLALAGNFLVDKGKKDELLPAFNQGDDVCVIDPGVELSEKQTKPLPRFSEITLIKELENKNIGRPSTYAEIMGKIIARNYVDKKSGIFHATDLGKAIIDTLVPFFDFMELKYTAKLENDLDKIASGDLDYVNMISVFYTSFKDQLKKAYLSQEKDYGYRCDDCNEMMFLRHGSFGFYLACYNYPECRNTLSCDVVDEKPVIKERKINIVEGVECPTCSAPMAKRDGKWGAFYSCSRYPRCNGSRKIPFGKKCMKCNNELYATIYNGKNVLFCMNYPACKHSEELADDSLPNPNKLCNDTTIPNKIKPYLK